jgi:hypothetical protein
MRVLPATLIRQMPRALQGLLENFLRKPYQAIYFRMGLSTMIIHKLRMPQWHCKNFILTVRYLPRSTNLQIVCIRTCWKVPYLIVTISRKTPVLYCLQISVLWRKSFLVGTEEKAPWPQSVLLSILMRKTTLLRAFYIIPILTLTAVLRNWTCCGGLHCGPWKMA